MSISAPQDQWSQDMTNILILDSAATGPASISHRLTDGLAATLRRIQPDALSLEFPLVRSEIEPLPDIAEHSSDHSG